MSNESSKNLQGLFFKGVLEGLEPTPSGEIDGNKYGASLKLNFSTIENITKIIGTTTVTTPSKRNFKVSIDSKNEELPGLIAEWEKKLNQEVIMPLQPIKDGVYKMSARQI